MHCVIECVKTCFGNLDMRKKLVPDGPAVFESVFGGHGVGPCQLTEFE